MSETPRHHIHLGDNLEVLLAMPDACVDLIYIDPPFNTGKSRRHRQLEVTPAAEAEGDRLGFRGRRYHTKIVARRGYRDTFGDYQEFLWPRLEQARRVLAPHGSLYFHADYHEAHYCKVWLDEIFGRDCFLNEIIWAYDYGGRTKNRWPAKHDNILLYVKTPGAHLFNSDEIERIPYMAPTLVGAEKAKRGKLPTDTWWHTIVVTNSHEKTGYPTQKPVGILKRMIAASSPSNGVTLDFFAGSGTAGAAAAELDRRFILIDNNPEALKIMAERFKDMDDIRWHGFNPECI